MLTKGESFKYGFNNSSDPCPILGIENVINQTAYIYTGTVPPEPIEPTKKSKNKWLQFKSRKKRIIYW